MASELYGVKVNWFIFYGVEKMSKVVGSKQVAKKSSSLDEALFSAEIELDELLIKLRKLEGFLSSPAEDEDGDLRHADAVLLREQVNAMQVYADRLNERISRFKSIRNCILL